MNTKSNLSDKAIIHYFSGTGNAKSVAYWIGEKVYKQSIGVQIKNIGVLTQEDTIGQQDDITSNTILGFCYPTHGFNAPPIVLKYMWNFPRATNHNKVFIVNTRAGMKLSKIFLPGLSGLALLLPAIILLLKGYKIVGYRSIDLPSNWISIHPGIRESVVNSIFIRCKRITLNFSDSILAEKKVFTGLWWLPIDLLLMPIAIMYYIYGRFILSKTFIATQDCNACGLCIEACPVNAISFKNNRPYWSFNCESCMHCMNHCPTRAIETPHFFITILWWISFSLLPVLAYSIVLEIMNNQGISFTLVYKTLSAIAGLTVIFGGYWLTHKLMTIKPFNAIVKYTSLTSYKFWRRYKAPTRFN